MIKKEIESVGGELIVCDNVFSESFNEVLEQIIKCAKEKNIDINFEYPKYKIREITSKLCIKLIQISLTETTAFPNKHECDLIFLNNNRLVIDGHLSRCSTVPFAECRSCQRTLNKKLK